MCNQVRGAATRFWLNGQQFRFLRIDPAETQNPALVDVSQDTIRGSFEPHDDDVVSGVRVNRFNVRMQPNVREWEALLPILNFEGGPTWNLATGFSGMAVEGWIDRQTSSQKYTDCVVDKIIGRCNKGPTPLTIDLSIVAKSEEDDDDLPDENLLAGRPFVMKNAAINLEGNAHTPNMVAWGIDYHVDAEYNNSEETTDNCPSTYDTFFATSVPYFTANERALYSLRRDTPDSGAAGTLTFSRTDESMQWSFGMLRLLPKPPAILSRLREVRNGLFYKVLRTDDNPLLRVVMDVPA